MEPNLNVACSTVSAPSLAQVSDDELLAGTRRLVGRSNQLLAELLVHLGEVEQRGIHRTRACPSLYTYCIYELRLSEDEAFRRVAAARLVRRFPGLFDAVASGELHFTGLLMLGPHLTEANLVEVLARAKHRTKRELALVRLLHPLPAVPARIEPLGPAPARGLPAAPSWAEYVQSMNRLRELAPGERPRDWVPAANDPSPGASGGNDVSLAASVTAALAVAPVAPVTPAPNDTRLVATDAAEPARDGTAREAAVPKVRLTAPARGDFASHPSAGLGAELEPVRYKVQFTATENTCNSSSRRRRSCHTRFPA